MSARKKSPSNAALATAPPQSTTVLDELRQLIGEAQRTAVAAVNVTLTMLYWRVGRRIREEVLRQERAEYGEQIVATLSRQLSAEYGRGFAQKNVHRMVQFAEAFPDETIVATLWRQLSWSHFRELLPLKQPLQREFYAQMCRIEGWGVRTLSERIDAMLYERTALSRKPEKLIRQELEALRNKGEMTPAMVLKDPYMLDFIGLADRYLEKDLEDAILRELETFLLELGAGFSFIARQKAHPARRRGLLHRLVVLQPAPAALGGGRIEARPLQARLQEPDGVVPALARPIRTRARRTLATWHHSLRREEPRAGGIARDGRLRYSRRRIPDGATATRGSAPAPASRNRGSAGALRIRPRTMSGSALGRKRWNDCNVLRAVIASWGLKASGDA